MHALSALPKTFQFSCNLGDKALRAVELDFVSQTTGQTTTSESKLGQSLLAAQRTVEVSSASP